jgi:sodium/hydrogen antiporter
VRESFETRSGELIEIVKLGIFVVFGSLLAFGDLFRDGWAVAIVAVTLLVIRPLTIFISLLGTRLNLRARAFIGWFGPKGVATMAFSLLVLGKNIEQGGHIFNIAALAVLTSIIAHGLTDHPGSEWMARHSEREREEEAARAHHAGEPLERAPAPG